MITRLFIMGGTIAQLLVGRRVSLPGQSDPAAALESGRPIGKAFEWRVCPHGGSSVEPTISEVEAAALSVSTTHGPRP